MVDSLEEILRFHGRTYSAMAPQDGVKLLYQNEFGGGHLIRDAESCLEYLRREYATVKGRGKGKLVESIGNGLVRVHLDVLPENQVEDLGQAFLASAQAHRGTMEAFLNHLEVLRQVTKEGAMPFSPGELEAYLETYLAEGCPMVRHSEVYRQMYHPAYRVVMACKIPTTW